jgi:hypothetical protein
MTGRKPSLPNIIQSLDPVAKANRVAELLAKVRKSSASSSSSPAMSVSPSVERIPSVLRGVSPRSSRSKLAPPPSFPRTRSSSQTQLGIAEKKEKEGDSEEEGVSERRPLLLDAEPLQTAATPTTLLSNDKVRLANETAKGSGSARSRYGEADRDRDGGQSDDEASAFLAQGTKES